MSRTRIGGIKPLKESQKLERGFWNAAVPSTCVVPLQQHVGSRLMPLVQEGDVVREGMIIADGEGRFAVPVHAPIPGRVSMVGRTRLFDNTSSPAIMIELAGEFDRLGRQPERQDWESADRLELREMIRNAGVISTGRAPIPLHIALRRETREPEPVLVLDLAETEPYLSADAELARTHPEHVLEGILIARKILDSENCHVVASTAHRGALNALRRHADKSVRFHRVAHRYPANLDGQLRRMVLPAREWDTSEKRVVTISPSSAYAVYEAVVLEKPQIERVIAVGGGALGRPAHIRIAIGTSVADVLAECGGLVTEPARIVAGGPLTGSVVHNIAAPLPKNAPAVLALTAEEIRAGGEHPCIRCGACIRACPVSINPIRIHDLILDDRLDEAEQAGMNACVECGLCAHVCPARIPLVDRIRRGKKHQETNGE